MPRPGDQPLQGKARGRLWVQQHRQRRKAQGWQMFDLWLPPEDAARLMALKQPGETLTQLIGRLVRTQEAQAWAGLSYAERRAQLLARIKALSTQEKLSQQQIAARLNAEHVPTLTGRGPWRGSVIDKLLKEPGGEVPRARPRRAADSP